MKRQKVADSTVEIKKNRRLIDELFSDYYRDKRKIYALNFFRGIFFGFGSAIGGTLFLAVVIWILSLIAGFFPSIGGSVSEYLNTLRR